MLEFFHAIGIPIAEVWGMSELSCVATAMPLGRAKIGTVGTAMPGVELRIASDGEVLVAARSSCAAIATSRSRPRETIDADGWLHTGDIGELDADGFLRIVDRKKELIINADGKNMSPANIEATLKASSPLIGQACVIGDARPYNVALLVLDPDGALAFCRAHGSTCRSRSSSSTMRCAPRSTPRSRRRTRSSRASSRSSATRCSPTSGCPAATS